MSNASLPPELVHTCAQAFVPDAALDGARRDAAGLPLDIRHNEDGHINDTFIVRVMAPGFHRIVLQRINVHVFQRPVELMDNMLHVTKFLRKRVKAVGGNPARDVLTLLRAPDGKALYTDAQGGLWRAFPFIEGATTVQRVTEPGQLYQAGRAFGRFQNLLADFPADSLHPVIPDFHNTPVRFAALEAAVAEDPLGRAAQVRAEIDFALSRREEAGALQSLLNSGELPLRVTHNDTKINNVMLDAQTGEAVCVIDLDTVMPGSLLFDFGDAIRSGVNTGDEDEPDLSKVHADLAYYAAFTRGFLEASSTSMTPVEREWLPVAGRILSCECGVRFLTDHLLGDAYFKIHRPGHNLDRARTQFQLVRELAERERELRGIQAGIEGDLRLRA